MFLLTTNKSEMLSKNGRESLEKFQILKKKDKILLGKKEKQVKPHFFSNRKENQLGKNNDKERKIKSNERKERQVNLLRMSIKSKKPSTVNYFPKYESIWKRLSKNIIFSKPIKEKEYEKSEKVHKSDDKKSSIFNNSNLYSSINRRETNKNNKIGYSIGIINSKKNNSFIINTLPSEKKGSFNMTNMKNRLYSQFWFKPSILVEPTKRQSNQLCNKQSSVFSKTGSLIDTKIKVIESMKLSRMMNKGRVSLNQSMQKKEKEKVSKEQVKGSRIVFDNYINHKIKGYSIRPLVMKSISKTDRIQRQIYNNPNPEITFSKTIFNNINFEKMVGREKEDFLEVRKDYPEVVYNLERSKRYLERHTINTFIDYPKKECDFSRIDSSGKVHFSYFYKNYKERNEENEVKGSKTERNDREYTYNSDILSEKSSFSCMNDYDKRRLNSEAKRKSEENEKKERIQYNSSRLYYNKNTLNDYCKKKENNKKYKSFLTELSNSNKEEFDFLRFKSMINNKNKTNKYMYYLKSHGSDQIFSHIRKMKDYYMKTYD